MNLVINWFIEIPFWGRVVILLFLFLFVFWRILWRPILWVLSIVPYILKVVYRYFFLLLEMPVAALHKKFGERFHGIDNQLSKVGEKIDDKLDYWYETWHSPNKYHFVRTLLFYCVCVIYILMPLFIKTDNLILNFGERIYSSCESFLISQFQKQSWYEANSKDIFQHENLTDTLEEEPETFEIELLVSGITTSLLVRDNPSMKDGNILERLKNDDIVIWTGEMRFSEVEDSRVEPWVRIETSNGIVGWSRLFYLHPEPYIGVDFYVSE